MSAARVTIHFYAKDGSQIGHGRKRSGTPERIEAEAARLARGIDLRTRRQIAGVDSRKVARTEIVEGWS
jgi:hypothetical protein